MISRIALPLMAMLFAAWAGTANAYSIIDFDDLNAADGTFVPQAYNDLTWWGGNGESSWVNNAYENLFFNFGAHSGNNFSWSNGGTFLELSGGTFDIHSLWVGTVGPVQGDPTLTVTFQGLFEGAVIFEKAILVVPHAWAFADLNFTGIDRLRFDGDIDTNLMVDDIAIPEPTTLTLLGLALFCVARMRRGI